MDETEARDVMIEFYNMPDEPLSEKEYQMTVSMIQQNPTYLKAFEKIWEEEED